MVVEFAGKRTALKRGCVTAVVGLLGFVSLTQGALAQTPAPAKPASSADIATPYLSDYVPSEALKRQALGPMRIIQSQSKKDKEKEKAAAPAAAPAPVAKAPAKEAAAKPAAPAPMVSPAAVAAAVPQASPVAESVAAPVPTPPPPVATQAPVPQVAARPRRTELIPVRQDPPRFSPSLMRDSQRATVKVAFDVNEKGDTENLEVVGSTNRRLNSAATDAVAKWKFEPLDDAVRVEIDLVFNNE